MPNRCLEESRLTSRFRLDNGLLIDVPRTYRPPNLSPPGAGRNGAFREAKRNNDIPVSQQPTSIHPNTDKRGHPQPGRTYEFDTPDGTKTIRDDAGGHDYGPNDPQTRGPHFNDDAGNHYDYD
jgi:hypothetical protein